MNKEEEKDWYGYRHFMHQRLEEEKKEKEKLQQRIDKTIETIDEILVYDNFSDVTQGFGNIKEQLKFYLSDCKTIEEFRNTKRK